MFIVVGLGVFLWPEILNPEQHWALAQGESTCMLAAFSLLCLLGLRYPLQMLPVLPWETVWKTLWLLLVPFPQMEGRSHRRGASAYGLCLLHGDTGLSRDPLGVHILALRQSAWRSLARINGIAPNISSDGITYSVFQFAITGQCTHRARISASAGDIGPVKCFSRCK